MLKSRMTLTNSTAPESRPFLRRPSRASLLITAAQNAHKQATRSQRMPPAAAAAAMAPPAVLPKLATQDLEKLYSEVAPANAADTMMSRSSPAPGRVKAAKRRPLPLEARPGAERDPLNFKSDASVRTWGSADKPYQSTRPRSLEGVMRAFSQAATSGDFETATYWAHHVARFGFLMAHTASSLKAYDISSKLASLLPVPLGGGVLDPSRPPEELGGPLVGGYVNDFENTAAENLWEGYGVWKQDIAWIKAGVYKMPWDILTPNKQYNPLQLAANTAQYFLEGANIAKQKLSHPDSVWLQGNLYPNYYIKSFHYQTDGWMSDTSASRYEFVTEVFFQGRQDAMQRTALVPISQYIKKQNKPLSSMKLLEVAAGTGRFHTFIKDNWPEMPTVCSDLSPFYLQRARANMQEWKALRQPFKRLGGVDDTGVEFRQMAAEKLDMPDSSVDIVLSVYLLHELPEPVRRKAVGEMFRVLKPGGLCVLGDSLQRGDRPDLDAIAHKHADLNEPFFINFVSSDLGALFREAGFVPQTKYLNSLNKWLTFIKP